MQVAGSLIRAGRRLPGRCLLAGGAVAAASAAARAAACGGGGGTPAGSPAPPGGGSASGTPAPAATAPVTGTAARAAVTSVWEEFFNARTPTRRRVVLLQNGPAFRQVLATQARLPVAAAATARVSRVVVQAPGRARVTCTILASGQPVLSNQAGVAVYSGGTWKVGQASFCRLLVLEYGGSTSSLPAVCRGAG
ncbi:MAG: hypothetical protein ACM32E_03120 [Gemmatimonadota bacterium]